MNSLLSEATFRWLLVALLVGVLVMRVYFVLRVRRAGERILPDGAAIRREGRGLFFFRVVLFCLLIAFLTLYLAYWPGLGWLGAAIFTFPGWLRWLGFGLGLVSLGLWFWVQVTLGAEWSPQLQLRAAHRLQTAGPFAILRHPMYTAMVGYGLALALLTANAVFAAFALLTAVGLAIRAPREEQMLLEAFGDTYRTYMQHAGRFLPKLR